MRKHDIEPGEAAPDDLSDVLLGDIPVPDRPATKGPSMWAKLVDSKAGQIMRRNPGRLFPLMGADGKMLTFTYNQFSALSRARQDPYRIVSRKVEGTGAGSLNYLRFLWVGVDPAYWDEVRRHQAVQKRRDEAGSNE